MRISDWSSDVCSSDLLTPILYNLVSHVLTCTGVGRNPFTRERLFAGSIASHRGDAAALRRAALSCGYFRGADGARHRGRLGHGAGDGEGLRSEESTSELQSLMRISSAVFSFAKKN